MKVLEFAVHPRYGDKTIVFAGRHGSEVGIDRLVGRRIFRSQDIEYMKGLWSRKGFEMRPVEVEEVEDCSGLLKYRPVR